MFHLVQALMFGVALVCFAFIVCAALLIKRFY